KGASRPGTFVVSCADAGFVLTHFTWDEWNSYVAVGKGTAEVNDCIPNCAAGQPKSYPVLAVAAKPSGVFHRHFTELRVTFIRDVPPNSPSTKTFHLWGW